MRRDLIFFVNGVPEELTVHDAHSFFAPVSEDIIAQVTKLGEDMSYWLRKSGKKFHAFVLRNNLEDETESMMDAYEKLSGILDGYAFFTDDAVPEIWPLVQIRENDQPNAKIRFFSLRAWFRVHSKDGSFEKIWNERNRQLLNRFLAYFDLTATNNATLDTELANQISLSAKMFRHGRMSSSYGIDYLCKFTALEGLVCGSQRHGHGELLERRLSVLFRHRKEIGKEVQELWRIRCEASHQGKAFATNFTTLIEPVEKLTLGALVFAVDHVRVAKTVDELWDNASGYTLPDEAIMERPPEIQRRAVVSLISKPVLEWTNVGKLVDHIFDSQKK